MKYTRISHSHPTELPPVTISATDRGRLASIATAALTDRWKAAAASNLLRELDRATIVPDAQLPTNVVAVHSVVHLRDNITGKNSRITLVLPGETCTCPNAVSVLTLSGAALIGLSEGASIDWCTASGDHNSKTVLRCEWRGGAGCWLSDGKVRPVAKADALRPANTTRQVRTS